MAITDKAAKGAKEALELIIGKSKAGTKAARVIPPPLPPRPPAAPTMMGHNGGPLLDIPYTMRGDAIAAALAGHPSARSIMRGEPNIVGSGVTNIGSQKATALASHTSGGLLDPELLPPVPVDISNFKDYTLMGIVGDNSGRKRVTDVMGDRLRNAVDTQGGFQYIDRGTQGYAGAQTATSSKLNEAMKTENPLYTTILMSEQSPDFAVPTSKIFSELIAASPISSKNAPQINEAIRNIGVPYTKVVKENGKEVKLQSTVYPFKDFQDISVPGYFEAYVASLPSGTQRAGFLKGLDKAGLQKLGLPRVSDARLAMADEGQIGMDWGSTGYRVFQPDLKRGMYETTPDQSLTYSHGIDKVGPAYTLTEGSMGIPYALTFPDVSSVLRAKGTGGGLEMSSAAYKVFEGSPKRAKQRVNDMVIDLVSTFRGIETRFGREAAMRFAADTVKDIKVTPAIIEAARKANAPNWVIAAMAPTTGLLSMSPEEAEAQEAPRAKKEKR